MKLWSPGLGMSFPPREQGWQCSQLACCSRGLLATPHPPHARYRYGSEGETVSVAVKSLP